MENANIFFKKGVSLVDGTDDSISLFLVGLLILLVGCMGLKQPMNKIEYYTLEYTPPHVTDLKPLSHVIRLEQFTSSPTYNTSRIIYKDQSFKRDSYFYYR